MKLNTQPSVTFGSKRKPCAIVAGTRSAAGAANGSAAASNVMVPPPRSIGSLRLADGREAKGFLVEAAATTGARDITRFGGWRNYLSRGAADT